MFHSRSFRTVILTIPTIVAFLGCGDSSEDKGSGKHPKTYAVSGTVLLDGQPVADASVSFRSATADTIGATGRTADDGSFTLTTFVSGDGAIAGHHKVTVLKVDQTPDDPSYSDVDSPNYGKEIPPGALGKTTYVVAKQFTSFDTSGIQVTVEADGDNDVLLEVSAK